ncbi:MAG: OmpA family protein [Rhizobiales bacterium]|nr:OmpA family protein [Hyphomicrobiales bacterium]
MMRPDVEHANALGELRSLLFGGEARRLEALEGEVRRLAELKLARADLLAATADVIAGSLREAEVTRHRELADALAPLIVAAIQAEIRNSKDSMVEALYPLMGRLVSAAVANSIRQLSESLAQRIDALVSTRHWKWRARSLMTGRPIGEIALAETQRARISRVLCLERHSGTLIAVWPEAETDDGRSDLVSGLIAAITEFAATTFAREGGELRALDLGPARVLLRSSATTIVAAEIEGVLQPDDEERIDNAFLALIGRLEQEGGIEGRHLAGLDAALDRAPEAQRGAAGRWILRAVAAALVAALLWWAGAAAIDWSRERRIVAAFETARAARPALAAFPLRVDVDHAARRAAIVGVAPDAAAAAALAEAVAPAAAPYETVRRVEIVATEGELRAASEAAVRAAQDRGQAAETRAADALRVAADQSRQMLESQRAALSQMAARVEALGAQETALTERLAAVQAQADAALARAAEAAGQAAEARRALAAAAESERQPAARLRRFVATAAIFFGPNTEWKDQAAAEETAGAIAELMNQTGARVRLVGHTDETGSPDANLRVSRARVDAVARLLTDRGVPQHQIVIASRRATVPLSDAPATAAFSVNRRVTFELPFDHEPGP